MVGTEIWLDSPTGVDTWGAHETSSTTGTASNGGQNSPKSMRTNETVVTMVTQHDNKLRRSDSSASSDFSKRSQIRQQKAASAKIRHWTLLFCVVLFLVACRTYLRHDLHRILRDPQVVKGRSSETLVKEVVPLSDACRIAGRLQTEPLNVSTYYPIPSLVFPNCNISFPHISTVLCDGKRASWVRPPPTWRDHSVRTIIGFKAARTGSTFFTEVVTKTLAQTKRPTTMVWEPYARKKCIHNATFQEKGLEDIFTRKCHSRGKCKPNESCREVQGNQYGPPVNIVAMNPRFLDLPNINFTRVFQNMPQPHVVSLRRTNLVLMGYSKFHHGNCNTDRHNNEGQGFSLPKLLRCVEHYVIGDQEISSSVAHAAVKASGGYGPFLVVYEDVLANGPLMQKQLLTFFGVDDSLDNRIITTTNMFVDNTHSHKLHAEPFCAYDDVDCATLAEGLQDYPCLAKQLKHAQKGWTWSVPLLPNGGISMRGDCFPLKPLTDQSPVRTFEELYAFSGDNAGPG